MTAALLEVIGLKTWIGNKQKPLRAVDGIDFTIAKGETFALLGESACGKSMTALSLLRLNPDPISRIEAGQIIFKGQDLLTLSEQEMESIRGRRIAMIFQEPQSSLNPVLTVGEQIAECIRWHQNPSNTAVNHRIISLLDSVGIADAKHRVDSYPHQLSGGMKQRIMIAMALAGEPDLLIADEPTTALDVTIQAQILTLLKEIQAKMGMAILLISHDLAVVAQMADHVAVMYAGQIVETAPAKQFFEHAKHPYSNKLFEALPSAQKRNQRLSVIKGGVAKLDQDFDGCRFVERCERAQGQCYEQIPLWHEQGQHGVRCHLFAEASSPTIETEQQENPRSPLTEISSTDNIVLDIKSLSIYFPIKKGLLQRTIGYVKAVDDISLTLNQAETLALVGESGCGKTTVAKAILQLVPITNGDIRYFGTSLNDLSVQQLQHIQASLQIVFQDPYSSMNPRMTIAQIIGEGIDAKREKINKTAKELKVDELLHRVGLQAEMKYRYPHEFSGGQRQRICIARALATDPEVIICDEPTSALDVSVQAQVLNLLREIQHEYGLSYLFITHNISVVSYLAHRVAVMYLGKIVEVGTRDEILNTPKHPYTQALLAAVPEIDKNIHKEVFVLEGELPSATNPPDGCHFYQRCPQAMPVCQQYYPQPTALSTSHQVRCFLYEENKNNG